MGFQHSPIPILRESKTKEKMKLYKTDTDWPLLFGRPDRPPLYGRPDRPLLCGRPDSTPLAITVADRPLLFGRPISPPLTDNKLLT